MAKLVLACTALCLAAACNGDSNGPPAAPTGLALATPTFSTQYGGAGGTPYSDACPTGQAAAGYRGFLHAAGYLGQIQTLCGTLTVGGATPTVSVGIGTALPPRGLSVLNEWTAPCPANQVVVGFTGRSGALIDQLVFRCAPLTISTVGGSYSVAVGGTTDLAPVGGAAGSAFAQTDCPAGAIATVTNTQAGDGIDAFGLGCSVVSLVFD